MLLLLVGLWPIAATAADAAGEITALEFKQRMQQRGHLHVVDIRDLNAYQAGTLSGAVHLRLSDLGGMQIEPEADVVLISDHPLKAEELPTGYGHVWWLIADRKAWEKAGLKVVRVRVKPAFVIPRGLCEMNAPADAHEAEVVEEEIQ